MTEISILGRGYSTSWRIGKVQLCKEIHTPRFFENGANSPPLPTYLAPIGSSYFATQSELLRPWRLLINLYRIWYCLCVYLMGLPLIMWYRDWSTFIRHFNGSYECGYAYFMFMQAINTIALSEKLERVILKSSLEISSKDCRNRRLNFTDFIKH